MRTVGREHDGSYGSGRFCSDYCRRSYCGKLVKHHVCNFKNKGKKAPFGTWKCNHCDFIGETKAQLISHKKEKHPEFTGKDHKGWRGWNNGLTAETNESIKRGRETYKRHLKEGKFKPPQLGKPILEETKKKISESMKKAHAEGRAHNIGNCRWNNEPSYSEKFFMEVIANEFEDKNYTREYPFFGFFT